MTLDYDPSRVPKYPRVEMRLTTDPDTGDTVPWLEGTRVDVEPGQSPREALIAAVARIAARRDGAIKAVRAQGHADGSAFLLIVDSHANVVDVTPRRGMSTTAKVLIGAGVAVAALTATVTGVVLTSSDAAPAPRHTVIAMVTPAPTASEAPQNVPVGFADQAMWASDPVPPTAQVAAERDTLFSLMGDSGGRLAAVNVASGKSVWSIALPDGFQATSGPNFSRIGSQRALVLASGEQVLAYDLSGKQIASQTIANNAQTIITPNATIVTTPGHASILTPDGLTSRVLPPDATALDVAGTHLVAATNDGRVWLIDSDHTAPDPATVKAPKGQSIVKALGSSRGRVIVALSDSANSATFKLAAADPASGHIAWTSSPITGSPQNWSESPNQSWAMLNGATVDLSNGKTQPLPSGWQPLGISDDYAWGNTASGVLTMTRNGLTDAAKKASRVDQQNPPGTPVASCGGIVIMLGQQDNTSRLYALTSRS